MLPNQSIISQNIKGLSVSFLFFSLLSTLSPKVLEDQKEGFERSTIGERSV
jgi:hypothetical protein